MNPMRTLVAIIGVGVFSAFGVRTYEPPKACCVQTVAAGNRSESKQYKATITKKDSTARRTPVPFTDYCTAKSNSEATTIFKERHPGATVSGVRESK